MSILYDPPHIKKAASVTRTAEETIYRNHRGELHRTDGPARISQTALGPREEYYINGKLHREDGPARIWDDGSFEYYNWGILAGGGPTARRFFDDTFEEWRDEKGNLHRVDGPALVLSDGSEFYCCEGELHRTGGPAIDRNSLAAKKEAIKKQAPIEAWYQHGKKSRIGGAAEIYGLGAHIYWLDGKMHRADGPAIVGMDRISTKGYRRGFMKHGRPHHTDGPAIVDAHGTEYYYLEGVLHNDKGPAIVSCAGEEEYYLEGVLLTKEGWRDALGK